MLDQGKVFLKKVFLKQYMEEIALEEGLTLADALWSWERCRSDIENIDDVDFLVSELKNE